MAQSNASNVTPIHGGGILAAGAVAPNFTLHVTPDQTLTLSDLLGRPVILAFYPADWSPVCGDQMALYNEIPPSFTSLERSCWGFPWTVLVSRRICAEPSSAFPAAGGF